MHLSFLRAQLLCLPLHNWRWLKFWQSRNKMFNLAIHETYEEKIPKAWFRVSSDDQNPNSNSGGISYEVNITKCNGVVHLSRDFPPVPLPCQIRKSGTVQLFVVAVPSYFHGNDFLRFCGSHLNDFARVMFIWNNASEYTYSVLITLKRFADRERFYSAYNGKRFKPDKDERCHIYVMESVRFRKSALGAVQLSRGFMTLPSCPVCLERLDGRISGIQDQDTSGNSFDSWNNMISCQVCQVIRQHQYDDRLSCLTCGTSKNRSICFICGYANCERCEIEPGELHWYAEHHRLDLDLKTQAIRDSVSGSFVHRLSHSDSGKDEAFSQRYESMCIDTENGGGELNFQSSESSNSHDMKRQMGSANKEKNEEQPEQKKARVFIP